MWIDDYQRFLSKTEALNNAQLVVNFLLSKNKSWSKESLSALCGNMYRESSLNPNMYELGYGWDENRGFGLCQWTPRTKLSNWCDSNGLNFRDGNAQCARINYEAQNRIQWIDNTNFYHNPTHHDYSFLEFISNSRNYTIVELTIDFCFHYERPGIQYGEDSLKSKGIPFAIECFEKLDFKGSNSNLTKIRKKKKSFCYVKRKEN